MRFHLALAATLLLAGTGFASAQAQLPDCPARFQTREGQVSTGAVVVEAGKSCVVNFVIGGNGAVDGVDVVRQGGQVRVTPRGTRFVVSAPAGAQRFDQFAIRYRYEMHGRKVRAVIAFRAIVVGQPARSG